MERLPVKSRLVKFDKDLPAQLLACHAESVVMSATTQGQGKPGKELITLDLQRAHQIDEQGTNDARSQVKMVRRVKSRAAWRCRAM